MGDGESVRVVHPSAFPVCVRACVRVVPRLAYPGWVSGTWPPTRVRLDVSFLHADTTRVAEQRAGRRPSEKVAEL